MLDQLVRAAKFHYQDGIGGVILAENAPDTVTNPELATFIWLQTASGVPTGDVFYFNGTSWQSMLVVKLANIPDGLITPIKLSVAGSNPYDILQVKSDGSRLIYVNIIDAIRAGLLTLDKLTVAPAGNYILTGLATVTQWSTVDAVVALIANNTIPVNKLSLGADRQIIVSFHGINKFISPEDFIQNYLLDNQIPIDKMAVGTGLGLQAVRRNASNTAWEFYDPSSINPPLPPGTIASPFALIVDSKATNAPGGDFNNGAYRTRDLTTIQVNQNTIISGIAANQFTFGVAGTYRIRASAPAYQVGSHQIRLYNITAASESIVGTSAFGIAGAGDVTRSELSGLITVSAGDTFEIQHICGVTKLVSGFGLATNLASAEIYTTVEIQKVV